jgi:hypothetical protein
MAPVPGPAWAITPPQDVGRDAQRVPLSCVLLFVSFPGRGAYGAVKSAD